VKLADDTRIAGEKTVADWTAMRGRLNGDSDRSAWTDAFTDFFETRLMSRYFEPIKAIAALEKDAGEGFAIIALHCSLIEFLAATLKGVTYRYQQKGDSPLDKETEYSNSGDIFVEFLESNEPFKGMFSRKGTAKEFYSSVRNGLLHDARTKGRWRIRVCESANQAIDVNDKVVYRNKMQAAFDQFVDWYRQRLRTDAKLQQAFIRKFDSLCDE
jgi:hypothetical protein